MTSISESTLSAAVCDQYAFYPFRALVSGGVDSWDTIDQAEQFIRTVLLHDYVEMDGEPMPSPDDEDADWTEEEIAAGGRPVITAFLPILDGYEEVLHSQLGPARELSLELSPRLLALAAQGANSADPENAYHKSHIRYLQNLSLFVKRGGSLLTQGWVGQAAAVTSQELPTALLHNLDRDLKRFAAQANRGELGVLVPPFLGVLLSRAGTRDRLVPALVEMRQEWRAPRAAIWKLLHALRSSSDLREANELIRELDEISASIRGPGTEGAPAANVVWEVTTETGAAAVDAWMSAGNPLLGAAVPAGARLVAAAGSLGKRLFGLGGFSLTRRIARDLEAYRPAASQLRDFLTDRERAALHV